MARPRRNSYDSLRLKRAHDYIHAVSAADDGEIAERTKKVLEKFFSKTVVDLKGWLSQVKAGRKASVSNENLWSLIYALDPDFECKIADRGIETLNINHTSELATILHYAVSPKFLTLESFKKAKDKKEIFFRKGFTLFDLLYDKSNRWIFPRIYVLDEADIAIDVAELASMNIENALDTVRSVNNIFSEGIDDQKYREAKIAIEKKARGPLELKNILLHLLVTWKLNTSRYLG